MNQKHLFLRLLPATFLIGALLGAGVGQLGAAFKGSAIFRDVPAGSYADDAIGEMVQLGIMKGLDSAHFGPNEPVTRGQMAVLFQRLRNEMKGMAPVVRSSPVRSSRSNAVAGVSSSSSSPVAGSSASSPSVSSFSPSYNPGGSVRFDANQYNVDKNTSAGQMTIIIVRTGGNTGAGTVEYSFSGGTAAPGKNYQPLTGTLTFGSKETSKKLTMQIMNDTTTTGTKTVNLLLKNAKGSIALGTPSAVTLNINDPHAPSSFSPIISSSSSSSVAAATTIVFSASAYGVAENGTSLSITVNRTGETTNSVGVSYATADDSARAGADYTATSGSFTFVAGETSKSFSVAVSNNAVIDGSRVFKVVLSNPTGGAGIALSSVPVTIIDDEAIPMGSGSLKFSNATYSERITSGSATITVNHILGVRPATVLYMTSGGSAAQGIDYTAVSGTLTFAANEVSKTFTVPLLNNPRSTGGKTVNLTINNPTGAALSEPGTAVLTINL